MVRLPLYAFLPQPRKFTQKADWLRLFFFSLHNEFEPHPAF